MRIDDRKVNGRVLLDALDPVEAVKKLTIALDTGVSTVESTAIT